MSVANKFAGDGVKFVDGHFCSSSSIPASKVYTEEGILQITPASTNPKFTDEGSLEHVPHLRARRPAGQGCRRTHSPPSSRASKVAILNDNSTYGKGIADETKKAMNSRGKQEVLYQAYMPGEKDYSALVSRLKQAGIEVVYFGGYHTEIGLIVRQAREQGLKATLMGGDALVTAKEFWQITGPAGEGS